MNKILFAMPTCNRSFYAKNCIDSIFKFVDLDRIQLMVLDNCTIEDGWEEYLNKISKDKNIIVHRRNERDPGELYHAMNWAIEYCRKEKIDIVHWIQDDYQYLYKSDLEIDSILGVFAKQKNIVQVRNNIVWKCKSVDPKTNGIINCHGVNFSVGTRPADNGYTRVAVYDDVGLYPKNTFIHWAPEGAKDMIFGEKWFGQSCVAKNLIQCISLLPTIGILFDVCRIKGNHRIGKYVDRTGEFYIKEFDQDKINKIKDNNKNSKWSFIEELAEADGWISTTFGRKSSSKEETLLSKRARM